MVAIVLLLCLAFLLLEASRQGGSFKRLHSATGCLGIEGFTIGLGEGSRVLASGVTCMSRSSTLLPREYRGVCTGDTKGLDLMGGPRAGTFEGMHMGIPSEQLSASRDRSPADRHAFAPKAHRRAAQAVGEGHPLAAPQMSPPLL